jgi:broad specificity phosphatase PhoE/ribonuclease HI
VTPPRVVVEADGGSRGNPGNAAYGAVLKDADTGEVIAERAERIGVASNNVAEYRGLIAGLELYREHADGAALEVRMDSKLVVEQMSGSWKIKHPAMKPLALQANRLAPPGTRYTWIPREQNSHADRLANLALDGPEGVVHGMVSASSTTEGDAATEGSATEVTEPVAPATPPWEQGEPTTLVLVRHGDTDHTRARTFSGSTGADPALNEHGRAQVAATADWLAPLAEHELVMLSSPMRRTRETADVVAGRLGASYEIHDGLVEAGFGTWEGLTYKQAMERDPDGFTAWLGDTSLRPGGTGDSMDAMRERMDRVRDALREQHAGRTVLAVTHLTPIKMLLQGVLELPMEGLFRTEVLPASVTVLTWYPDGRGVVRLLNGLPGPDAYVGASRVR